MADQKEKYNEALLASEWDRRFKESMVVQSEYTQRWQYYIDAYFGDYFKNDSLPDYKSNLVSNYIFSIVETIRPIMLDNDPKFQSIPRHPQGMSFSNDLQSILSYEWDREGMNTKLYRELITKLVLGTVVWFVPWNKEDKNVNAIPISPFNIFPDPLATSVEDAEYIIYASYKHVGRLKRLFPHRAKDLIGGAIQYSELVHDNDKDSRIDNQVLVLEVYSRDYDSLEEVDSNVTLKYPRGRVLTICPDLNLVLSDRHNPYRDGKFPFVLDKDYDVPGKFWGEGEIQQLISPQKYMNELNNAILDNAKMTANMPWIVDNNAGIPKGSITSRPGLVIRKNPGTDVKREQPPSMPGYVINALETYKEDIQQISGIFDTLKGQNATGVYTAQGILALQEAGQARIRLKVKVMEEALGKLGQLWYSRIQQFWRDERFIQIARHDGEYDLKKVRLEGLKNDYDIKILAGSTMPVNRGAMLDLMIRLAQTQMPDGTTLVDREAVVEYLPPEVKSALLKRMKEGQNQVQQQMAELQQALQMLMQQLQQLAEESRSNDEQTMSMIEEITQAIEQINMKILQLEEESARIEEEKRIEEERNQIRTDSYNQGYLDAENILGTPETMEDDASLLEGLGEDIQGQLGLPEDILSSIEELSDDELALLLQTNPELADLLR